MGIHAIAKRAAEINQNISLLIVGAINNKEVELLDINRSQILNSKNAKDRKITPRYKKSYATFKGFAYPNLKLTGDFQREMYLNTDGKKFHIESFNEKNEHLKTRYHNIFGIAPSKQSKAQQIAVKELLRLYYKKLLNA
jgi:hypothetical protein